MTDFNIEVTTDSPPPPPRRGQPGVGEAAIIAAREAGEKALKADQAPPWIVVAKVDADGVRQPSVNTQTFYNLRNKYQYGGPHHEATGEYFDVALTDRVTQAKHVTRGVLWVKLGDR